MKKHILTLILILFTFVGFGQYTLFNESVGTTATGNPLVTAYVGWNTVLTFGATISASPVMSAADVRLNPTSTGYVGSTGGNNVFFTSTIGKNFQISSISTIDKFNLKLSFGAFKSTTASNMSELILEFSTNGTTYTTLNIPSQPTGTGTAVWRLIPPISLPSSADNISNLRLRWRQTSTTPQFRIDDIKLTYETALPIELTEFTGTEYSEYNVLKWQTSSEHNNSHYILERSSTGDYTEKDVINVVNGAGNSTQLLDYNFVDTDAPETINYYRLTQVDYDGNFKQYGPISIDNRVTRNIPKYFNIMGQEVNEYETGLIILRYEDGTVEKVIR